MTSNDPDFDIEAGPKPSTRGVGRGIHAEGEAETDVTPWFGMTLPTRRLIEVVAALALTLAVCVGFQVWMRQQKAASDSAYFEREAERCRGTANNLALVDVRKDYCLRKNNSYSSEAGMLQKQLQRDLEPPSWWWHQASQLRVFWWWLPASKPLQLTCGNVTLPSELRWDVRMSWEFMRLTESVRIWHFQVRQLLLQRRYILQRPMQLRKLAELNALSEQYERRAFDESPLPLADEEAVAKEFREMQGLHERFLLRAAKCDAMSRDCRRWWVHSTRELGPE